jgi:hypothetical protein
LQYIVTFKFFKIIKNHCFYHYKLILPVTSMNTGFRRRPQMIERRVPSGRQGAAYCPLGRGELAAPGMVSVDRKWLFSRTAARGWTA